MPTAERRALIKRILSEHAANFKQLQPPGMEEICVFDEAHDEYLWLTQGWLEQTRLRELVAHVRLRDDKFWIEADTTAWGLATDLMQAGIPQTDIILAFHPPAMRRDTEAAAA